MLERGKDSGKGRFGVGAGWLPKLGKVFEPQGSLRSVLGAFRAWRRFWDVPRRLT